jgi:hypothetical protein
MNILKILRAQFWGGSYILSTHLLRCQTLEIHMYDCKFGALYLRTQNSMNNVG